MALLDTRALVLREQDPEVLRTALLNVLEQVDLTNEFADERTLLSRLIGPTVRRVGEQMRLAIFQAMTGTGPQ